MLFTICPVAAALRWISWTKANQRAVAAL